MKRFFSFVENNFVLYYLLCCTAGLTIRLVMAEGDMTKFWSIHWFPLF